MRCSQRVAIALLIACSGCKSIASDSPQQGSAGAMSSTGEPSGDEQKPGSSSGSSQPSSSMGGGGDQQPNDSGAAQGGDSSSDPNRDPALPPGEQPNEHEPDAGSSTAPDHDAAVAPDAGEVGMIGTESCCTEHASPGCTNAGLQVCVCEKLSSCCTDAWDAACVLIVTQRYCQAGVRDCVCGDGADQWGQHACCDSNWGDSCDTVAQKKCGAVRGCF